MEQTQSSEMSAFNTQTPGKYPEDNLLFLMYSPKLFKIPPPQKPTLQTQHFTNFLLNFSTINWWERILFLLNAAFVMEILGSTSRVHFAPFAITLPRELRITTMNKNPTRCTIVLKSLQLYCSLIPLYMFRALLRPSSGAS
jgi:hypothetical protein